MRAPRARPRVPYWACLILWAATGPLGAGAAASGRWGRGALEAALSCAGLFLFSEGMAILRSDGSEGLAQALADGAVEPWRAWTCLLLLCLATGLWAADFFRMPGWHRLLDDPFAAAAEDEKA